VEITQTTFEAIGTHWNIQVQQQITPAAWEKLLVRIHARIDTFDKAYSRFRDDSLVTAMSRGSGTYQLPADGYRMLTFYEQLYKATNGAVTPLIGQTIADAGYDATYSFASQPLHTPPSWEDTITYDKTSITLHHPALLDFGAAGKGYLVDIIGDLLAEANVMSYLVNGSGDIRYRSAQNQPLEVGLENPFDTTEAIGTAQLVSQSICASAGSKRAWRGFNHIIDPNTLSSPEEIAATWVVANDTMTADGLATALFFTDAQKLEQLFTFSYAILHQDMSLQCSKDFPVTAFNAESTSDESH
jgi:thiamine biosynthesis lipoprotein